MPHEHKSRREVLSAIEAAPSIRDLLSTREGHYDYELDLEVVVYGRNYNGKKVGPYLRLLTYDPGEAIVNEGDWGGNTFYIVVDGSADVFVTPQGSNTELKVSELQTGSQFGEMSVLGGVPRNATVKAAATAAAQIIEVQRPALRLLRKLSSFAESLDKSYRAHGRNSTLDGLKVITGLDAEMIDELREISLYRVYTKNHVLFRQGTPTDRIYIIKEGWLRRDREAGPGGKPVHDFLGKGFCFGADAVIKPLTWPHTATLMGRTEVFEISITRLRQKVALRGTIVDALARFAPPEIAEPGSAPRQASSDKVRTSQEALIETGLVDATNLLVMDMDLCVRCGNCSLACHKVHGRSRLVRRGIHVTRLKSMKSRTEQSVLAPQVCLHCKDPECLTGCPTGAIGRLISGQIDIDRKTCIGCGDCAAQCPYDAISMIPRKSAGAPAAGGWAQRLKDLFRLTGDTVPPAVEETEDLLAVKCNLCANTSLNPPGSKHPAYSCEENCPTGALARIDPASYFDEIGGIRGFMMVDRSRAVGRNIHKSDPGRRLAHAAGIALTLALTAAAWYGIQTFGLGGRMASFLNMRWITGMVGLIGIGGAMAYPFRRQIYLKRAGALRYWLLFHSYAGVVAAILILLHAGRSSGGWLTTTLTLSFDLTIVTGLLGIALYKLIPRALTSIEGSPLLIDDLRSRRQELGDELNAALLSASPQMQARIKSRITRLFLSSGFLLRQYFLRRELGAEVEAGIRRVQKYAEGAGDQDRQAITRAAEAAITARRVDALIYLHRSLKLWLPPHIAASSLMIALLAAHIIQVIYFAAH
jgi:Fe-S-cluster-containing dehydrogenase component/CRP-like cAMP-binding protein